MNVNQRLGNEIKRLRKARGLTQKKLADLVPISQISMNKIENGLQKPKEDKLRGICDALNIPV